MVKKKIIFIIYFYYFYLYLFLKNFYFFFSAIYFNILVDTNLKCPPSYNNALIVQTFMFIFHEKYILQISFFSMGGLKEKEISELHEENIKKYYSHIVSSIQFVKKKVENWSPKKEKIIKTVLNLNLERFFFWNISKMNFPKQNTVNLIKNLFDFKNDLWG